MRRAVEFDAAAIKMEPIRAEDDYGGVRVTFPAHLGKSRISIQVDVGVGDAVWPAPKGCAFPSLLDLPAPDVLAYPRENPEKEFTEILQAFLEPVLRDARSGAKVKGIWAPGGPWKRSH